jgi:DNA repair protein RadC
MQNENRAKTKTKAKHKERQAKRSRRQQWFALCRETKVVVVREEPVEFGSRGTLDTPERVFQLWDSVIARSTWFQEDKEHMVSLCLDARYRLKSFSLVSMGLLNESIVHAREIFRPAIAIAAHSLIMVHNHPSGDPNPRWADLSLTRRIYLAGELMQIPLLDHIIVGDGDFFSFKSCDRLWSANERSVTKLWDTLSTKCRFTASRK